MKLRNLLFGTMIACAFVACSNDDDPNPTPNPTPEGDGGVAELIVSPDLLKGNIDSKALTKAAISDKKYLNYMVYVFDRATGANIGHGEVDSKITIQKNPGAVDVMVIGNVGNTLSASASEGGLTGEETKAEVLALTKNFFDSIDDQGASGEESGEITSSEPSHEGATEGTSQSSHLYPFTLQSGLTNKVGYNEAGEGEVLLTSNKIQLYRHVAKIVLNKITIQNKTIAEGSGEIVYSNPKLKVDRTFILNAQFETKLANVARWGSVFKDGTVMGAVPLKQFNAWMTEAGTLETETTKAYIPVTTSKTESNYKQHVIYNSETDNIKGEITASKTFTQDNKFYVYESTVNTNPTLLVVEGTFSYDDPLQKDVRVEEKGYYTVELGKGTLSLGNLDSDLFPGAANDMGVRRNIQYNVNMTVKAPGSKNPLIPNTKVASLETLIELVDYGTVSSESTFE